MNLTTKLKEANLSQSRFALEIGLKQQTISKWCNKKSTPKLETMQKIAEILNCDIQEVIDCFVDNDIKEIEI